MALRDFGLAGFDPFQPGLARQVLGGDLAVAVHDDDQRLGRFVFHHQRLHDRVRVQAKLARGLAGAAVVDVVVGVLGVGHLVLF